MAGVSGHRWWNADIADRIAVLTFTRPPSNWMSIAAMTELADALDELAGRTSDATVVVLTGGVDGYFIAHADLDDLASLGRCESVEGDPRAWRRALSTLESMPQPTVAAIDGQAWGGGCETALACTVRLGSERAHLGQPEVTVGVIPGAGGTQRLAVFAAKRAVNDGLRLPLDEGLRLESRLFREVNASPEARAANAGFPRPG